MFFYKLKKLFKLKKWELILGSLQFSFIASFASQFFIFFIWSDYFSKRDKRQMFLASSVLTILNLFTINLVSVYFYYSVVLSIFVGILINFFIYIIPMMILIILMEWSDLYLTKEEIRDAKIGRVLRKLL
jgi:fatty acid desaturase